MENTHGLDADYFIKLFARELKPDVIRNQTPHCLARVLARAARTACAQVLLEHEFVPVDRSDDELFETWWEDHGQYLRAGGRAYEKSFAYHAYLDGRAMLRRQLASTPGPGPEHPEGLDSEGGSCD